MSQSPTIQKIQEDEDFAMALALQADEEQGGCDEDIDDSKSVKYVRAVIQKLSERGYNVRAHLNGAPDKDFLTMASSRYFVPSGGGYSLLIAKIVLKRNNKVYLKSQKGFIKADAVASMVDFRSEILN